MGLEASLSRRVQVVQTELILPGGSLAELILWMGVVMPIIPALRRLRQQAFTF